MRYLSSYDLKVALNIGKGVEQFIGPMKREGISLLRYLWLVPEDSDYELWVVDCEDVGSEDYVDISSFPTFDEDPPTHSFQTLDEALSFSQKTYGALPGKWVNQGVVQDEYLDYKRGNKA